RADMATHLSRTPVARLAARSARRLARVSGGARGRRASSRAPPAYFVVAVMRTNAPAGGSHAASPVAHVPAISARAVHAALGALASSFAARNKRKRCVVDFVVPTS